MSGAHFMATTLTCVAFVTGCNRSDIPKVVRNDVDDAMELVSTSTEQDTARIQRAFDLVKKHPQADAINALVRWLDSSRATERRAAIYTLQMLPWENPSGAYAELRKLLGHAEALTRGMAAMALASLGDRESSAVIRGILSDDADRYVRRCAAWALGELDDASALDALQKAATDPDASVAANAKNALERLAFLQEHKDVQGDAAGVIRGVWLISGSTMQHAERIDRALDMIRTCPEPQRRELLQQLATGHSVAIQNSAALALTRL